MRALVGESELYEVRPNLNISVLNQISGMG